MKNILLILICLLWITSGWAGYDAGLASVNDTINFPVFCLDTSGIDTDIDSAWVVVRYHGEGANDSTYAASGIGAGTAWLDSNRVSGRTVYYFIDLVGDLDANKGNGLYTGDVMTKGDGLITHNMFSFTKVGDEAKDLMSEIQAILDTLQNQDNWILAKSDTTNPVNYLRVKTVDDNTIEDGDIASIKVNVESVESNAIEDGDIATIEVNIKATDTVAVITSIDDKTGYSLANGEYAKVWYGIDTSASVDTSDIGDWLKNNLAGAGLTSAQNAKLDSLYLAVGTIDTSSQASLHDKIGAYSGQAGDNNNIKDDIEAISLSGGGTQPETLIILSSVDSTQIESAKITIRTLDGSTVKVNGLATDVIGKRILALDADSFWIEVTHNNYIQVLDTLIVSSGGGTDTLFMTRFNPGAPENPNLCRVYGWIYDIGGDSLAGIEINAEIPRKFHPVKYSNLIITPFNVSTSTDSTGYWYLDLIPNSLLSEPDTRYLFTIKYNSGVIYRTESTVPDTSSWQLQ